jgi:hypothetical protein
MRPLPSFSAKEGGGDRIEAALDAMLADTAAMPVVAAGEEPADAGEEKWVWVVPAAGWRGGRCWRTTGSGGEEG